MCLPIHTDMHLYVTSVCLCVCRKAVLITCIQGPIQMFQQPLSNIECIIVPQA